MKHTHAEIVTAVTSSKTIAEALRKLEINLTGHSHAELVHYCKKHKISRAHMLGKAWRRGKGEIL